MKLGWKQIAIGLGILVLVGFLVWAGLYFFGPSSEPSPAQGGTLGTAGGSGGSFASSTAGGQSPLPTFSSGSGNVSSERIFKITDGPVLAAVLVEQGTPTTTVARYMTAQDGHVLDIPLDVSGAAPRAISNTTIPGITRALWNKKGTVALIQYLDSGSVKTASLAMPTASSSNTSIHFFPDDIKDLSFSPDGTQVAYLIASGNGTDGYTAAADSSSRKKLFSTPLAETLINWNTPNALLLSGKSFAGVPGIIFTVNAKTGAVSPALYGFGITATADPSGRYVLYRTDEKTAVGFFSEALASGKTLPVSLAPSLQAPVPETCAWATVASSTVAFCAAPSGFVQGYLDLWHMGASGLADTLVGIDPTGAESAPVVTPGTRDGGEATNMFGLSLSPNLRYLSFISKNTGSLWGVRLQ